MNKNILIVTWWLLIIGIGYWVYNYYMNNKIWSNLNKSEYTSDYLSRDSIINKKNSNVLNNSSNKITTSINTDLVSIRWQDFVVYKSTSCICCDGYASALKKAWANVKIISDDIKLQQIKNKLWIPGNKQACHTTLVWDRFIEGHVPLEVVAKFVWDNNWDIVWITLPWMPTGVPGMPWPKRWKYKIEYMDKKGNYYTYLEY